MHPTAPSHGVRGNIERPGRVAAQRTVLVPVLVLVVTFPHFTKSSLKQNSGAWSQVQAAGDGHSATHRDTPSPHGEKAQTNPAGQAGFAAEQKSLTVFMVHANPGLGTLARQEHVLSNGVVQGPGCSSWWSSVGPWSSSPQGSSSSRVGPRRGGRGPALALPGRLVAGLVPRAPATGTPRHRSHHLTALPPGTVGAQHNPARLH